MFSDDWDDKGKSIGHGKLKAIEVEIDEANVAYKRYYANGAIRNEYCASIEDCVTAGLEAWDPINTVDNGFGDDGRVVSIVPIIDGGTYASMQCTPQNVRSERHNG